MLGGPCGDRSGVLRTHLHPSLCAFALMGWESDETASSDGMHLTAQYASSRGRAVESSLVAARMATRVTGKDMAANLWLA